jgi:DNA invertase Pin-like site-specific DNA recombinase
MSICDDDIVATYDYKDADGTLLFQVVRYANPKDFRQRRPDGNGGWIWNLDGVPLVPYRLPDLIASDPAEPVYVVEGEKDVDRLISLGLVATTNPMGAGKWPDAFGRYLLVRDVRMIADNDDAGRKHVVDVGWSARKHAAAIVRNLELQALPPKGDVSDWLDAGHTAEELRALGDSTPAWTPPATPGFRLMWARELIERDIPEPERVCGFLSDAELVLVVAWRGVGKTHLGYGMFAAIASGGTFLHWKAPKPKRVLYVDGELPVRDAQARVRLALAAVDKPKDPSADFPVLSSSENRRAYNIAEQADRTEIEKLISDYGIEVLGLDSLSTLHRGGEENKAESWQDVQDWLVTLRARGIAVVAFHHTGKDKTTQRGTSKREDVFDWSILLKLPEDYVAGEGARFEIEFKKTRHHRHREDVAPVEARLGTDPNGKPCWSLRPLAEARDQQIRDLVAAGRKPKAIAAQLGVSRSLISKVLNKTGGGL